MKTNKKAISLIVLVITIIVLAILAATVIITITNSGVINSAKDSTGSYNVAQEKAQVDVVLKDWAVTKVTQTGVTFIDFLSTNFGAERVQDNEDGTANITMQSGNTYKVQENGSIVVVREMSIIATGMPLQMQGDAGVTGTLKAVLQGIKGEVTWANEDDSVATISSTTGESITVTAVGKGSTKVTATCGGYTAEYTVVVEKVAVFQVGSYVQYDVSYTDMYQGIVYNNSAEGKYGWRYLGTEPGTGKHLIISTGIPILLEYAFSGVAGGADKWWDTDTSLEKGVRAANGMLNDFDKIPYEQQTTGTSVSTSNTTIGRFAATSITNRGKTYNAIGDYFKANGKTYTDEIIVRTLTVADLNRAMNTINSGKEDSTNLSEIYASQGFKNLTGESIGLFDMQDLIGYTANYNYYLATAVSTFPQKLLAVQSIRDYADVLIGADNEAGLRPVIVLPSDIQFLDSNEDGIWEIVDAE